MPNKKLNNIHQICSVKKVQYVEGIEKGLNVLLVSNGIITFEVVLDKCMDIYECLYKGENISFMSATGLNNLNDDFAHVFPGGLLYTCGLDTVGGRKEPIHGRIHNIPARLEELKVSEAEIIIKGVIEQTSLFGEKLCLVREIKVRQGEAKIVVNDTLINKGYENTDWCILYHTNLGYPFLDESCVIKGDVVSTVGRTPLATEQIQNAFKIEEPVDGAEEVVYFNKVNKGDIAVINQNKNIKVSVKYNEKILDNLMVWKSMVSGAYALGIEPATTTLDDDFKYNVIKPGEEISLGIEINIEEI